MLPDPILHVASCKGGCIVFAYVGLVLACSLIHAMGFHPAEEHEGGRRQVCS